ncbi:MAG: cellulase family glycosylhydrolase [Armatimonadetes bacterium]|nr:cellulase family glycosylhydrolase [Armatimonadota bacterium]
MRSNFKKVSLLAIAMSVLAPSAHAQDDPEWLDGFTDPIPKALRTGINLDGIYQADWQYMESRPCYDDRRLTVMLTDHDFLKIREAGFEHVRIPVSPVAFGVHDQSGAVDPQYVFKRNANDTGFDSYWPVGYHIDAHENFAALAADIMSAQAHDLEIIIDCHPWLVSQSHYNSAWTKGIATKPPSGTFMENFCTDGPLPIPITQNHPLPKFWSSFLHELRFHLEVMENPLNGSNVFKGVHFEVLNEPMVNFWGGGAPRYSEGIGVHTLPSQFETWKFDQLENWKSIQAQAIKAIYSEVDPEGSRVIVSTLTNLVDSYGLQKRDLAQFPVITYQFTPYRIADMEAMDCPGDYARRLIYAYHPYLPFNYTHKVEVALRDTFYYKKRDYGNDPVTPWTTATLNYRDNTLETENSSTRTRAMPYMLQWLEDNNHPAVIATEFGAIKRESEHYDEPLQPPTGPSLLTINDWQRLKWHYDMRTLLEAQSSGWTVFGYTSTWGMTGRFVYLQRFFLSDNPIYHRSESRDGSAVFDPEMMNALFGDSRPNGDGVDD